MCDVALESYGACHMSAYTTHFYKNKHCQEEKRNGAGKRRRRGVLERETRTSSGPVSSARAGSILSVTRPSVGRLNLARQEKLQVTTPAGEFNREAHNRLHSICMFESIQFFSSVLLICSGQQTVRGTLICSLNPGHTLRQSATRPATCGLAG